MNLWLFCTACQAKVSTSTIGVSTRTPESGRDDAILFNICPSRSCVVKTYTQGTSLSTTRPAWTQGSGTAAFLAAARQGISIYLLLCIPQGASTVHTSKAWQKWQVSVRKTLRDSCLFNRVKQILTYIDDVFTGFSQPFAHEDPCREQYSANTYDPIFNLPSSTNGKTDQASSLLVDRKQKDQVWLGGRMRADSPGHTMMICWARYSAMDLDTTNLFMFSLFRYIFIMSTAIKLRHNLNSCVIFQWWSDVMMSSCPWASAPIFS